MRHNSEVLPPVGDRKGPPVLRAQPLKTLAVRSRRRTVVLAAAVLAAVLLIVVVVTGWPGGRAQLLGIVVRAVPRGGRDAGRGGHQVPAFRGVLPRRERTGHHGERS